MAPVGEIFDAPKHPYTIALLSSIPMLEALPDRLTTIEGAPPRLQGDLPPGCPFEPRCQARLPRCANENPALVQISQRPFKRLLGGPARRAA